MSIENEYYAEKKLLENAQANLAKAEELDIEKMNDEQLAARQRLITSAKEEIAESEEILSEIKDELKEFINNGGEVSKELKEELSNEDDSSEDDVVEFEVVSTKDGDISISGYVYVDELDDEHPLNFYDRNGFECGTRVPSNPYDDMSPNWEAYEKLSSAFQSDELFLQFLSDFADENKTIDRGEYNLLINDGAIFEVEYRDYHSTEWGSDYYMAFTPKFNGEKVILNEEVCFHDPYTDEKVKVKDMIYENGEYIIEIPKSYWEYPQMEGICGGTVATEIISDYKIAFKKAYDMTINHGEDY